MIGYLNWRPLHIKLLEQRFYILSQPHKGHLTSKPHLYRRFPFYLFCTLLLFPFHLLPSPVHPTRFSFCFFPGFLAIFTLLSSNNNNKRLCRSQLSHLHYYLRFCIHMCMTARQSRSCERENVLTARDKNVCPSDAYKSHFIYRSLGGKSWQYITTDVYIAYHNSEISYILSGSEQAIYHT